MLCLSARLNNGRPHRDDAQTMKEPRPQTFAAGTLDEVGRIGRVVVKHARVAFAGPGRVEADWRALGYSGAPDPARAADEYDAFLALLRRGGGDIDLLPADATTGLDSIYVRDASIVTPRGIVLCAMGKPARAAEPAAQAAAFRAWGVPIAGAIQPPGTIEGGDVVWLDAKTVAVGRGYRTNDEGIRQLRAILGDDIDTFVVVPLPHWRGPTDVFHLMSIISPVDRALAVVHARLLPVPFRELLLARGYTLVDVPDDEFESMGTNVLALAPSVCVLVNRNPRTRARLEAAGCEVLVYDGNEISHKGGGGPTCLTRPLTRCQP
jgi:N-dimethylarginine dimethylaminohydrolase